MLIILFCFLYFFVLFCSFFFVLLFRHFIIFFYSFVADPSIQAPKSIFPKAHWISKKDEKRTAKRGNTPCKRWGHSVVLHQNNMYIFGGSGNTQNTRNWETIYILNCETFDWEKCLPYDNTNTQYPEPRDSHAATLMGNTMYVFGGSNGDVPLNDLFSFNFTTKAWNIVTTVGEPPSPREGHSGVAIMDRYFFIFGGWNGKTIFNDSFIYDSVPLRWSKIECPPNNEPFARESHTCVLLNDYVYVFGGQGNTFKKKETYYNDLHRIKINCEKDRKFGTWEKVLSKNGKAPSPRTSHSVTVYKDRYLFVIGGEGYSSDSENGNFEEENVPEKIDNEENEEDENENPPCYPKNDVWIFDTVECIWIQLDVKNKEIFSPRFTHSCCLYQDNFIIFGGLKDFKNAIDDLIMLSLDDSEYKRGKLCSTCKQIEEDKENSSSLKVNGDKSDRYQEKNIVDPLNNYALEVKPFLSCSLVDSLASLISWPFSAFGLFLDNANLIKATHLNIVMEEKPVLITRVDQIGTETQKETILRFEYNTPSLDLETYDLYNISTCFMEVNKDDWKTAFARNLKLGAFRLGETMLLVCKTKRSICLVYSSTKFNNNPDLTDFIIFICEWEIEEKVWKTHDFYTNKKNIFDNIGHILTEKELMNLDEGFYVFILNLKKVKLANNKSFSELIHIKHEECSDILINMPKNIGLNSACIEYSLKNYLEYFFMDYENIFFKLSLDGNVIVHKKITEQLGELGVFTRIDQNLNSKVFQKSDILMARLTPEERSVRFKDKNLGLLIYQDNRLITTLRLQKRKASNMNSYKMDKIDFAGSCILNPEITLNIAKSV